MTEQGAAVQTIGRIDAQMREWIARWQNGSTNGRARVQEFGNLMALLEQGESLIKLLPHRNTRDADTIREFASYAATLRELEAIVVRLEISARLRRSQIEGAHFRLTATAAWASRVQQLL